jgi:hypothetical protein
MSRTEFVRALPPLLSVPAPHSLQWTPALTSLPAQVLSSQSRHLVFLLFPPSWTRTSAADRITGSDERLGTQEGLLNCRSDIKYGRRCSGSSTTSGLRVELLSRLVLVLLLLLAPFLSPPLHEHFRQTLEAVAGDALLPFLPPSPPFSSPLPFPRCGCSSRFYWRPRSSRSRSASVWSVRWATLAGIDNLSRRMVLHAAKRMVLDVQEGRRERLWESCLGTVRWGAVQWRVVLYVPPPSTPSLISLPPSFRHFIPSPLDHPPPSSRR